MMGHLLIFATSSFVTLVIYLKTLSRSIAGGDSGELVAEGCQLGTAHPPGYPLYTILVYIVTKFVPKMVSLIYGPYDTVVLTPVLLVNIMSSILGAATSGFISSSVYYLSVGHVQGHRRITLDVVSISTGLLHSFSPLAWQYSVTAEVFALHNFFTAWIVHTAIRFFITKKCFLLYSGAFISGLALANQHTSILLLVPVLPFVIYCAGLYKGLIFLPWKVRDDDVQNARLVLGQCIVIFLITILSFYSMLPVFSFFFPHAGSWGDMRSVSGFFQHLLRKDYGTLKLFSGDDKDSEGLLQRIKLWCIDFSTEQTNLLLFLFFVVSLSIHMTNGPKSFSKWFNGSADKRDLAAFMVFSALVFYLIAFHSLSNLPLKNRLFYGIHQRFWLHPNVLAFILIGDGMNRVVCRLIDRTKGDRFYEIYLSTGILLSLLLLDAQAFWRGYRQSDQSTNSYFRNYALSILETLPKHSLLLINYDQQWTSIRYLQECELIRRDIVSINLSMMSYRWWKTKRNLYPNVIFPGHNYGMTKSSSVFTFSELVQKNYRSFGGNIFIGGHLSYPDPKYLELFEEIPHGLVRRISKKMQHKSRTAAGYGNESLKLWTKVAQIHTTGLPNLKKYPLETWEWTIHREFFDHLQSRATFLLDLAVSEKVLDHDANILLSVLESVFWLEISRLNDDYSVSSPSLYRNLGIAYMQIVRSDLNDDRALKLLGNVTDIFKGTNNAHLSQLVWNVWYNASSPKHRASGWKTWATIRWNESWSYYLRLENAKNDSAYAQIHKIYHMVQNNAIARK